MRTASTHVANASGGSGRRTDWSGHPAGGCPGPAASVAWDLTLENDKWGEGTDRHYTAGTRIARTSDATPQWVRRLVAPLRCLACTAPRGFKVEVGQEIYTPENTWTSALVVDDRPYAGWAYGSLTVFGERDASARRKAINELTLELGVVGPASLAERTQGLMHREQEIGAAQGWHHQLENELGAALTYKRGMRALLGRDGGVPPRCGAVLRGDVRQRADVTSAAASCGDPVGISRAASLIPAPGWRMFVDVSAHAVVRNALLGGNIQTGSYYAVAAEPFVASVATGVEYQAPRFRVSFTRERRGREFVGQREPDEIRSTPFSVSP